MDTRLAEFVWIGLLEAAIPRLEVLDGIRGLRPDFEKLSSQACDLSLTGLASTELRDTLIPLICRQENWRAALSPLRLFETLPALTTWAALLPEPKPDDGWRSLRIAVASMLDHQSEVATDARWASLFAKLAGGFVHHTSESQVEAFQEIVAYPRKGDLRKVRPMIRASEGAFAADDCNDSGWPAQFWDSCLSRTACYPLATDHASPERDTSVTLERIVELRNALAERCAQTRTTSAVDARHDGAFSIALYACSLLSELAAQGQGQTILSRLGLRTVFEATITLSFLMKRGTPAHWTEFRSFGAGQAKLAFLKLAGLPDAPGSVELDALEALASEDAWLEFVKVDLSSWAKKDLRRLSDECGLKDLYDRFYPWTSAYAHSQWHATRDVVFDTCGNPLHRLHRIPRPEQRSLPDVVGDAAGLVDSLVACIDQGFPGEPQLPVLLPAVEGEAASRTANAPSASEAAPLAEWHDTLLELQAQVFEALTGTRPELFVPAHSSFGHEINRIGAVFKSDRQLAARSFEAMSTALDALVEHYAATGQERLAAARSLRGTKCVLGGQQSLTPAGVDAAITAAAYFDTVLVPDPVHRWLEREPIEEGFPRVRMLEDIYNVAKLRPEVPRSAPHILLFPSLEKVLEHKDSVTQEGISRLVLAVCNGVLGTSLTGFGELVAWIDQNPSRFLATAREGGLFVPCGGQPGMPLDEALALQRDYLHQWRSQAFRDAVGGVSDAVMVFMNICDRLAPMFHLLDNANSFDACPILSSAVHWHYFGLCFSVEASRLSNEPGIPLFAETLRAIEDLGGRGRPASSGFSPRDVLAARDSERFVNFRRSLRDLLSLLKVTTGSGLDGCLRTVALELPRLLSSVEKGARTPVGATSPCVPPQPAALPWLPSLGAPTSAPRPFTVPRILLGRVPIGFYFPEQDD